MTPSIDHPLDKSQALVFKTSDGKTFSVSRERASLSSVWRDMLDAGGMSENSHTVQVEEKEEEMKLFLTALGIYGFETTFSPTLQDLKPSQLVTLLRLADKYHSLSVGVFVEQRVHCYAQDGYFDEQKLEVKDILSFFYYADILGLKKLLEISAKLSFQIQDLIKDVPEDMDFITRRRDLLPLHLFRQRWETIKKKTLEEVTSKHLDEAQFNTIKFFSPKSSKNAFSTVAASSTTCQPSNGNSCHSCHHHRGSSSSCGICRRTTLTAATADRKLVLLMVAFEELTFDEMETPKTKDAKDGGK